MRSQFHPQSSIERGVLSIYKLFYFDAKDIYFLRLLLYDVGTPEKKDFDIPKRFSTCQKERFQRTSKKRCQHTLKK